MTTVHLADTRVDTIDRAKTLHEEIAHAKCRIESKRARREAAIAREKSKFIEDTAVDVQLIADNAKALTAIIFGNPDKFKDPRAIKTDFGEFGMRKAGNKLEVTDEEAAIQFALDNGYDDLVETTRTLIKDAAKDRINDGEEIPGCSLPKGEVAYYKISKALIESARTLVERA